LKEKALVFLSNHSNFTLIGCKCDFASGAAGTGFLLPVKTHNKKGVRVAWRKLTEGNS